MPILCPKCGNQTLRALSSTVFACDHSDYHTRRALVRDPSVGGFVETYVQSSSSSCSYRVTTETPPAGLETEAEECAKREQDARSLQQDWKERIAAFAIESASRHPDRIEFLLLASTHWTTATGRSEKLRPLYSELFTSAFPDLWEAGSNVAFWGKSPPWSTPEIARWYASRAAAANIPRLFCYKAGWRKRMGWRLSSAAWFDADTLRETPERVGTVDITEGGEIWDPSQGRTVGGEELLPMNLSIGILGLREIAVRLKLSDTGMTKPPVRPA